MTRTALMSLLWVLLCSPSIAQDAGALGDLLAPASDAETAEEATQRIDVETSEQVDDGIQQRLEGIYNELDSLDALTVTVSNGIVTLAGTADSARSAERARAIAEQVDGVVEVVDEMAVDTNVARRLKATLERLWGGALSLIASLPVFVLSLAVLFLFWWLGRHVSARRGWFRSLAPNVFIAELLAGLARIAVVLIGLVLALSLLDATSILGTVLGAAGIVGLAVGFAVRDTVENYIASILLSLRTPFLSRDYVRIGDHEGHVARLTSRATILITLDGNHVRIPNAEVYKATIINFTRDPQRRFVFSVGVDTDLDLNEAQQTALDTVYEVPGVLREPGAVVLVRELGDSNVSLDVMAWVDQKQSDYHKVRSECIRHVKQAFDEAGIAMPEPIYRVKLDTAGGPAAEFAALVSESTEAASADGDLATADGSSVETYASDKSADRPERSQRSGRLGRAEQSGQQERAERAGRAERTERPERSRQTPRRDRRPRASDVSVDRATESTLDRELEHPDAENLLSRNAATE